MIVVVIARLSGENASLSEPNSRLGDIGGVEEEEDGLDRVRVMLGGESVPHAMDSSEFGDLVGSSVGEVGSE